MTNLYFRSVYNSLFLHMQWKRIASLTEDGQRYSEYLTLLDGLLRVSNFNQRFVWIDLFLIFFSFI